MRIRMIFLAAAVTVRLLSGAAGLSLSEDNLFSGFDGMVPGETRTQEIEFSNESRDDAVFRLSAGSASGFGMIVAGGGKTLRDISRIPYVLTDPDSGKFVRSGKLSEEIPEFRLCRLAPGEKKRYLLQISLPAEFGNDWEGTRIENSWVISCETYGHGDSGSGDGGSTGSGDSGESGNGSGHNYGDYDDSGKVRDSTGGGSPGKGPGKNVPEGSRQDAGYEAHSNASGTEAEAALETAGDIVAEHAAESDILNSMPDTDGAEKNGTEETVTGEHEQEGTELSEEGEEEGDMACCCFWWHLIEVIELAVMIALTFLIYRKMKEKKEDQDGMEEEISQEIPGDISEEISGRISEVNPDRETSSPPENGEDGLQE